MSENNSGPDGNPNIISRKSKGAVHEKSVKRQLLQILLQIKPTSRIWTEIILAKYDSPSFKNEREHPVGLLRPHHYIEKI